MSNNKEQATKAEPRSGILFNTQFVQAIADFMTTKPYKEVAGLIAGLQSGNVIDEMGIALVDAYLNKNYDGFKHVSEAITVSFKPEVMAAKPVKKGSTKGE